MTVKMTRLGEALFPERQILIRSRGKLTHVSLSSPLQAGIAAVSLLGLLGLGATHLFADGAAPQTATPVGAAAEPAAPAAELAADVDNPEADPATLSDRVKELEAALQAATDEDAELKAERERLAADNGKLEGELAQLEQARKPVKAPIVPRDKSRMIVMGEQHSAAAPEDGLPKGFSLDKFMARLGIGMRHASAAGGPYVALKPGKASAQPAIGPETMALLRSLPLTAPLDKFTLESGFGTRTDPLNGHAAMHTGLDFSAPYRTPVYSTSGGEVVFAGWAAAYGKMVEIDHGNGIHTRYAHLNRLMVNEGQHVGRHTEVGLLGSTGRSTGPHVHYEVVVNGVAQDPERFLHAGQLLKIGDAAPEEAASSDPQP
jgi:murein DD-endopeptidase MepM/ murein hydrolase activator NlpD